MNWLKLHSLLGLLCATSALAQGTFTYTFLQDTSPLHIWAMFQATPDAVATGLLTTQPQQPGTILLNQPHYILYQGTQCPITWMNFPVDPVNGAPVLVQGRSLTAVSGIAPNFDAIDIDDGIAGEPSDISIWRNGSPIYQYSYSFGQWSVSYTAPEPSSSTLLLFGIAALFLRRGSPRTHKPTSLTKPATGP